MKQLSRIAGITVKTIPEYQWRIFFLMALLTGLGAVTASIQAQTVSFVYPTGGQVGTTVEIMLSGNGLANAKEILVSGDGIETEIVQRPRVGNYLFQNPYQGKCRAVMESILDEERRLMPLRAYEDTKRLEAARHTLRTNRKKRTDASPVKINEVPTPDDEEVMRQYPYFHLLEKPSIADLQLIFYEYLSGEVTGSQQMSAGPISNAIFVKFKIAENATPGLREVKVVAPNNISRPCWFWVTRHNEIREIEPNEGNKWPRWEQLFKKYVQLDPCEVPVALSGQIEPGDIDRFELKLEEGQRLVFDMQARSLQPYVANAVPGWFTGLMTLFGPDEKEIISSADYRFSQDPLMFFKVPKSGKYMLEVRDSIFRGRRDFVYRIAIGEFPVVSSIYPLGGQVGSQTELNLRGGNLPIRKITPDFSGPIAYEEIREVNMLENQALLRPMKYMLETLPIFQEPFPKSSSGEPEKRSPIKVKTPTVIYGTIAFTNETDVYEFDAKKGEKVALDLTAQPLGSNLDAVLEVFDSTGKSIALNDDRANHTGPNIGNEVHHSDPLLMVDIPADGTYSVKVYGNTRKAGADCFYRLRISPPQPDFTVCVTPSCLRFSGSNANIKCFVYRKEGFTGDVELRFVTNEKNYAISGGGKITMSDHAESTTIVADNIKNFTVKAVEKLKPNPQPVKMIAVGKVGDKEIIHPVLFCDEWMQAFIWYHLVPVKEASAIQR